MKRIAALIAATTLGIATPAFAQVQQAPAAPRATPQGLLGFQVGVSNFDKSIAFYAALGLKLGRKPHPNEWELVFEKPATGASVFMMLNDPAKPGKVVPGGSFLIIGVADVAATVAKLRAAGFKVDGEPRDLGTHMVIILSDPDGNRIETIGPAMKKP